MARRPFTTVAVVEQPESALAAVETREDLGRAAELAADSDAPSTRKAYAADIRDWESYAGPAGLPAFPVSVAALAAYIGAMDRRGLAVSTIRRRCSAISRWHHDQSEPNPCSGPEVRMVLRGLARQRGTRPKRKVAASAAMLRAAMAEVGARDKAILSVGFVTGLRRSELVALMWSDVEVMPDGVVLTVRRSKTDQSGEGAVVGLPYSDDAETCPARTLLAWRDECEGASEDRVFPVSARTVARAVKRAAKLTGQDPAAFGAHSLRAGLLTNAAESGVSLGESMAASRHKSADVAATYVRPTEALNNSAHRAAADALGRNGTSRGGAR